jgi:3-deoxy-7-phosphoheptulonate synthase
MRDKPTNSFLFARRHRNEATAIKIGSHVVGAGALTVVAGPGVVESREGILGIAEVVRISGAAMLQGRAFVPQSSSDSCRGLGKEGLEYLAEAARMNGLPAVTEVLCTKDVELVAPFVDALLLGAHCMQSSALLESVGESGKPVILKRSWWSTIDDLLFAAEYILHKGNSNVILCEQGIRTFETRTRFTLDISAIPLLKQICHLPVLVDPGGAAGKRELVAPLCLAAIASGADGLMIHVHPQPDKAWYAREEALSYEAFSGLMNSVRTIWRAMQHICKKSL